jgi:hypothetical protein
MWAFLGTLVTTLVSLWTNLFGGGYAAKKQAQKVNESGDVLEKGQDREQQMQKADTVDVGKVDSAQHSDGSVSLGVQQSAEQDAINRANDN